MSMSTSGAAAAIAAHRPSDAVVISTMSTLRAFPPQSPSELNLSCVPLMGGAAGLGLGIALAQPSRTVLVLDGDGSLLMQLGCLATVAGAKPEHFVHFVFANGVWFEGGADFPVPSAEDLDWAALAAAAGYPAVHSFTSQHELDDALDEILTGPSPCFVVLEIDRGLAERPPWGMDSPQEETPDLQFSRMGDEARAIRKVFQADGGAVDG